MLYIFYASHFASLTYTRSTWSTEYFVYIYCSTMFKCCTGVLHIVLNRGWRNRSGNSEPQVTTMQIARWDSSTVWEGQVMSRSRLIRGSTVISCITTDVQSLCSRGCFFCSAEQVFPFGLSLRHPTRVYEDLRRKYWENLQEKLMNDRSAFIDKYYKWKHKRGVSNNMHGV
jgi:hypothetical protein